MNSSERKRAKRKLFLDSLMVFFIIASPFIFKLHEYVSTEEGATFNFLGMEIDDNGFANLSVYVWFMLGKLVPLYLLFIWFFTCKHWWYHIILIPITMYAFQIFEEVYSDDYYIDTENILWLLPICMVIIPFVYFIRIKLYDKYVHGIDLEAMEAELQELKEKNEAQGFSSTLSQDKNEIEEELKPKSISEEIDRKLSTNNLEQGLKIFQDKLENWFHFKF
ncbi:hypothetical protein PP182_07865 [Maribacter sp. PR1]|uniref:EXPERA domain-containing protein n=1 Tax=Maribacter cobaltidurans TaxID=1178778 RepID=A0ABU7ISN1_9FLAO|nr:MULTISPECIES: hypothetical protein [Maribacter]MDC6388595.1 hypothetical protein [Maribacter sp. PR1]MEE1975984.1 hypothetical protein [Maribacter cobaltidurans]